MPTSSECSPRLFFSLIMTKQRADCRGSSIVVARILRVREQSTTISNYLSSSVRTEPTGAKACSSRVTQLTFGSFRGRERSPRKNFWFEGEGFGAKNYTPADL